MERESFYYYKHSHGSPALTECRGIQAPPSSVPCPLHLGTAQLLREGHSEAVMSELRSGPWEFKMVSRFPLPSLWVPPLLSPPSLRLTEHPGGGCQSALVP